MEKIIVRNPLDRMVFEVKGANLEPTKCSCYDAYCYSDPEPDVEYIEYHDWLLRTETAREF